MDTINTICKKLLSGFAPFFEGEYISGTHRAWAKTQGHNALDEKAEDCAFYHMGRKLLTQEIILFKTQEDGKLVITSKQGGSWNYAVVTADDLHIRYDSPGTSAIQEPGDNVAVIAAVGAIVAAYPLSEGYQILTSLKRRFAQPMSPAITTQLLTFMDSVYYTLKEWEKEEVLLEEVPRDVLLSEIKQAYRTGALEKLDFKADSEPEQWPDDFERWDMEMEAEKAAGGDDDFKSELLAGRYDLGTCWTGRESEVPKRAELEKYIPVPQFERSLRYLHRHLKSVCTRIEAGLTGNDAMGDDYVNIQFLGKPGTGKSLAGRMLGAALGLPVTVVGESKNTEEDAYQGKNVIRNGKFDFVETGFLKAYREGGIILLEEYNLVDPGVLQGALGQAIVPPFVLHRDGYEDVRRHPLCVIVGTMNPTTQGTKAQNQAFLSRIPASYILDDPDEDDFVRILMKSGKSDATVRGMYRAYSKVMNYVTGPQCRDEEAAKVLTLRQCFAALDMLDDGVTFRQAIEDTLVGSLYAIDPELAIKVRDNVISILPEPERR